MNNKRKRYISLLVGLMVVILYLITVSLYSNKFILGTTINGTDCSSKTVVGAVNEIQNSLKDYKLKVIRDGKVIANISATDIEMEVSDTESIKTEIYKINKFAKPIVMLNIAKKNAIQINNLYKVNDKKLKAEVKKICNSKDLKNPVDAKIVYNEQEERYEIQKEDNGTKLNYTKVYEKIKDSILNENKEVNLDDCLRGAKIKSNNKNLNNVLKNINKYMISIQIDFGDRQENITPKMVHNWIKIKNNKVSFDKDAVRNYVIKLSNKYDTYGTTRKFKTHNGKIITISGGSYGWMIRRDYTIDKLIKTIKEAKSTTIEPEYSYKGFRREKDEIGDTYVEISLSEQHVYVYNKGKLVVDTPCVTGNTSLGRGTPSGIYPLNYKTRNATLSGQGYASPVSYWMPFNNNIGMHDASWRSSFGGNIYKTGGSHGCVNLPKEKAKQIYEVLIEKEPVIVY